MKKIIAIFLITVLMLCGSLSVSAATVYRYGDWTLKAIPSDAGAVFCIRSYDGSDSVVTVPRDFGGYPIISIEAYAFASNDTLQEVTISDNITSIGEGAFMSCVSLKKIEIPDSVTQIDKDAFCGAESLVIYARNDSTAIEYAKECNIDYVCTNVTTYLLGDADGDGVITILDATVIQRHLIMLYVNNPVVVEQNGDVNNDGLDITDATWIQRYIAEMDIPYPVGSIMEAAI